MEWRTGGPSPAKPRARGGSGAASGGGRGRRATVGGAAGTASARGRQRRGSNSSGGSWRSGSGWSQASAGGSGGGGGGRSRASVGGRDDGASTPAGGRFRFRGLRSRTAERSAFVDDVAKLQELANGGGDGTAGDVVVVVGKLVHTLHSGAAAVSGEDLARAVSLACSAVEPVADDASGGAGTSAVHTIAQFVVAMHGSQTPVYSTAQLDGVVAFLAAAVHHRAALPPAAAVTAACTTALSSVLAGNGDRVSRHYGTVVKALQAVLATTLHAPADGVDLAAATAPARAALLCIGSLCDKAGGRLKGFHAPLYTAAAKAVYRLCPVAGRRAPSPLPPAATAGVLQAGMRALQGVVCASPSVYQSDGDRLVKALLPLLVFGVRGSSTPAGPSAGSGAPTGTGGSADAGAGAGAGAGSTPGGSTVAAPTLPPSSARAAVAAPPVRVRADALACLRSITRANPRFILPHWTVLVPEMQGAHRRPHTPSLLTVILYDPDPKIRESAAACLASVVDAAPLQQWVAFALPGRARKSGAVKTRSERVASALVQCHRGLGEALKFGPAHSPVLIQVLKTLTTVVNATPYDRLDANPLPQLLPRLSGLATSAAELVSPVYATAVQSAAVAALGVALATCPPRPEAAAAVGTVCATLVPAAQPHTPAKARVDTFGCVAKCCAHHGAAVLAAWPTLSACLLPAFAAPADTVRAAALRVLHALLRAPGADAHDVLAVSQRCFPKAAVDPSPAVRAAAVTGLPLLHPSVWASGADGSLPTPFLSQCLLLLSSAVTDTASGVRAAVFRAWGSLALVPRCRTPAFMAPAVAALVPGASDPVSSVRAKAAWALGCVCAPAVDDVGDSAVTAAAASDPGSPAPAAGAGVPAAAAAAPPTPPPPPGGVPAPALSPPSATAPPAPPVAAPLHTLVANDALLEVARVLEATLDDSDKVSTPGARILGTCVQALLDQGDPPSGGVLSVCGSVCQSLCTCATSAQPKVRLNACQSLGVVISVAGRHAVALPWMPAVLRALLLALSADAFRVRLAAAQALGRVTCRDVLGSFYQEVLSTTVTALQSVDESVRALKEFRLQASVTEALRVAVATVLSVGTADDFAVPAVRSVLMECGATVADIVRSEGAAVGVGGLREVERVLAFMS